MVENRPAVLARLADRLAKDGRHLSFCYEAGPCGYGLHRFLTEQGHACTIVAPSLIPVRAGDRVKTDRRDAMMLSKLHRAGELTPVWVPDGAHEAMRDLVRVRATVCRMLTKCRQHLQAFLLRHGRIYSGKSTPDAGLAALADHDPLRLPAQRSFSRTTSMRSTTPRRGSRG